MRTESGLLEAIKVKFVSLLYGGTTSRHVDIMELSVRESSVSQISVEIS